MVFDPGMHQIVHQIFPPKFFEITVVTAPIRKRSRRVAVNSITEILEIATEGIRLDSGKQGTLDLPAHQSSLRGRFWVQIQIASLVSLPPSTPRYS
jgi:hypothetical protein